MVSLRHILALSAALLVLVPVAGAAASTRAEPPVAPGWYEGDADVLFGHVVVSFELTDKGEIREFHCGCAAGSTWEVGEEPSRYWGVAREPFERRFEVRVRDEQTHHLLAWMEARWDGRTSVDGYGAQYLWGTVLRFSWRAHHVATAP